jgi:hypothetical protein
MFHLYPMFLMFLVEIGIPVQQHHQALFIAGEEIAMDSSVSGITIITIHQNRFHLYLMFLMFLVEVIIPVQQLHLALFIAGDIMAMDS